MTGVYPPTRYAWYVVGVLTLANTSAFIDRQILGLLVGPIRRDLGISDAQMGILYGLAFALFYTVLGIPLGRAADRVSRRAIIGFGIAAWSIMTVLCGMARTYDQLLLARFGVAIGEAALAAPALSLIADYFVPDRRATALSVYALGIYLGAGLANLVGGALLARLDGTATVVWPLLGAMRPWQQVFVVVGLPGLVVALLMATVREPIRHETGQREERAFTVAEVGEYLGANARAFFCHGMGYALFALVNFATAAWLPTHLIRSYGWSAAQAGITLGALTSTIGVLGVVVGGRVADVLLARGYTDAKLRVGIIAALGVDNEPATPVSANTRDGEGRGTGRDLIVETQAKLLAGEMDLDGILARRLVTDGSDCFDEASLLDTIRIEPQSVGVGQQAAIHPVPGSDVRRLAAPGGQSQQDHVGIARGREPIRQRRDRRRQHRVPRSSPRIRTGRARRWCARDFPRSDAAAPENAAARETSPLPKRRGSLGEEGGA